MDSDDECPPDLVSAENVIPDTRSGVKETQSIVEIEDASVPVEAAGESQQTLRPGAVPVTILTGFLGAGKTTLLNFILTQDHGKRIAVIENEFGDSMDIEELIARDGADGSMLADNLFELKNGCICCTVKDDLVTTLEALLQRRNKFDYVIIETTGLANPGPVASIFWLDDALESALRLDGIVTLVDAKNILRQLERGATQGLADGKSDASPQPDNEGKEQAQHEKESRSEAAMQLAYADRVLVNKADLVSDQVLDDVMDRVRSINAVAEMRCTQRSKVDLSWVLDIKSFSPELALKVDPSLEKSHGASIGESRSGHFAERGEVGGGHSHGQEPCADCAGASHEGWEAGTSSVHDSAVTTHSVNVQGSLELARLERWLGALLWDPEAGDTEVYRVKGVVSIHGKVDRFVVQGVADLFEVTPAAVVGSQWREEEARHSKMVFIGRNLYKDRLEQGVRECMVL